MSGRRRLLSGAVLVGSALVGACATPPASAVDPIRPSDAFRREVAPFPVTDETGAPYAHPFLGGLDVPRPQFADPDGDGDPDLFIQERTDELMHFENVGSAAEPRFVWRTDRWLDLPVGEWSRFHDMDGDGDLDLLADPTAPRYVVAADTVRDGSGTPVFSDRQNIPNLTDIDCDGRIDLFLGRVDGTVSRFEEVARSDAGAPVFDLVTARFEDIEIVAAIAVPGGMGGGAVPALQGGLVPGGTALHGANSMVFADVDSDGDQDFFWGDFFEPGLLWIENLGSCQRPDLRATPQPVPSDELIATSGYNAAAIQDLDADGDLDLLIGVLGGAFNPNTTAAENLVYYERLPSGIVTRRTSRFLDGIDVGSESTVAFGDLDADGDLDMLLGSKLDPTALSAARLYHFENVGGVATPSFALRDTLVTADTYHLAPVLADLDADGDLDLMLGTWNQDVRWFRNDGTPREPRFVSAGADPAADLPRGSHSTPALGDLDGDGDFDLVVGESSGEINFFRNTGTPKSPRFELVTEQLGGLDVGRRSAPALVDLDGDGDLDLLAGSEDGGLAFFPNRGTPLEPSFEEADALDVPLPAYGTPVLVDLDGDGDLDLVSGGLGGGVVFFRNTRGG